ncbi:hypothetical protein DK419_15535 [Methylobacterium terrae]|uniref:Uncharacterized protein n=1 Tax=Methylobacterium terrae TaxID=2202827 RepID=A0A2U8WMQ2_9HYPH|nr:hypothetical protein [Methylobacterium terrae]AWN47544.1 hypothetical protein DK419_15535 [Methylobacterium terrae]
MAFGLGGLFGVDDYGRPMLGQQPGGNQMPAPSPYAFAGGMPGLGGQPTGGLPPGMGGLRAFGALPMPEPEPQAPGGSPLSFGPGSAAGGMPLPSQAAPNRDASVPRIRPFGALPARPVDDDAAPEGGMSNPPLPPPRPTEFGGTGSWDPPAETTPQAVAVQGGALGGEGPSMFDRFRSGISPYSDLLMGVGMGLMTKRGIGPAIATGVQYADQLSNSSQARDLASAKQAESMLKLRQSLGNSDQLAQLAMQKNPGMTLPQARAAVANQSYANELLKGFVPPTEQYRQETDDKGNTWNVNTRTGQRTVALQAKDGSFTLGPNQVRYDEAGNAVARGSPGAPQVKTFTLSDGSKVDRQLNPQTGAWEPVNYGGAPPEANAATNPFATGRFNNDQGKAAGFTDRMMGSEQVLRGLEDINSGLGGGAAGSVSQFTPNSFKTSDRQRFEQAKKDFVNSQLRRESGAAISQKEFENADTQYFPQPGDGADVIAQKRVNRQRAIEAMGREGGPSYVPRSVFDQSGAIVPYRPGGQGAAQPASSQQQSAPKPSAGDRFRQLQGSGLSRQEIYSRLQQEGY